MKQNTALLRLTRAAYLLVYTEKEIMDIALDCGYSGRQTFSDAFRAAYG